ncbi:hypothetical protein GCM10009740_37500 [Terrabacter terrae]|uniref:Phosphatidic acid phosphatase type 2/haloperoxidase domain-containing protein n=1 Tax=Terrabacter terrae TaxID=318434 RepID=A0ABN2UQF6_9MICO
MNVRRRFAGGRAAGAVPTVLVLLAVVAVLYLVRDAAYRATTAGAVALPSVFGGFFEVVGELGIVVLALVFACAAWRARSRGLEHVTVALVGATATVAAYVLSEVVKGVVREARPCRAMAVHTVAACPAANDWSWPSNHAVIAAGLATAVVALSPLWWRLVVPLALAVGVSRVLVGAHYWHDVVAGMSLGVLVVWFGTWALAPAAHRLLERSVDVGPARWRSLLGEDGRQGSPPRSSTQVTTPPPPTDRQSGR